MADPVPRMGDRDRRAAVLRAPLPEAGRPPRPLTSFIGRERDLAEVDALVRRDEVRLVTLVGPAGVGKTRLAIEVCARLVDRFADGIRYVSLASVLDHRLVIPTIARELGVWEAPHRALSRLLIDSLRDADLLLVLDNLEQVTEAAPALGELLTSCPRTRMLVTSRALLRISGEHAYPVPPLMVPDTLDRLPFDELSRLDAVRLFVQRAGAARAGFALDERNATPIATICHKLDGLPLAIELAAARVPHLAPTAMLARMTPSLPLLTGGPADAPPRQQTMRDAIAWSYDLLEPDEQRAIRRLSVFVGSCTLDAVAAVALFDDPAADALDLVSSLVDESLLSRLDGAPGEPRFQMLEAIREFGLGQLARSDEELVVRRAHADHFLELAKSYAPRLVGADQRVGLDRLEAELANLRVAISWQDGPEDDQRGLRMAAALVMLWYVRNHLREGWDLVQGVLADSSDRPTLARAGALRAAGMMAFARGDYAIAMTYLRASLPIAEARGDPQGVGLAWFWLGLVAEYEGDEAAAAEAYRQALTLFHGSDDELWRSLTLSALGEAACRRGDFEQAESLCAEAMELARRLGDGFVIWNNLQTRGNLELARDDWDRASMTHWEELSVALEIGDMRGVADGIAGVAAAHVGRRGFERGARLLGAADRMRVTIGRAKLPGHAQFERAVGVARTSLGDAAFEAAWEAGALLTTDEAVMLAGSTLPAGVPKASDTPAHATHRLSLREMEVLRLLVEGRSDREIARALSVSPRTAAGHVAHILDKLDAVSRTDAAVRAVRSGIV